MQTQLSASFRQSPDAEAAERALRTCVHCGFCLATCPTYQVLGNELDSPRGRIYLIKQVLEGEAPTARVQLHLDRCLTCRACETTCPSGVEYGKLLDIGREAVAAQVGRSFPDSLLRGTLQRVLTRPALFRLLVSLGRAVRGLLPRSLQVQLPDSTLATARPPLRHRRRMLLLEGCVQPALRPGINDATARVLDRVGISVITAREAGCCGALAHHLGDADAGREAARRNVDAWIAALDAGAEAIVTTASGCGVAVKDYGWLLRDYAGYADSARRVAAAARDVSEVLTAERAALGALVRPGTRRARPRIAWHPPCTLQHGQKLTGLVEPLLMDAGFQLTPVPESHLCCGSAGTYSLLQPKIAGDLRARKLRGLLSGTPERIVTANIGCLIHLQAASEVPVLHWVELLDRTLTPEGTSDANCAMPERQ